MSHRRPFIALLLMSVTVGSAGEAAARYPRYQWSGPYPYPYYYRPDPGGAVRLDVKPKEAAVYVDGYYAGIVDDFNGTFERLRLPPGEHEIVLYLDGYRTVRQRVYLTIDHTFKVKLAMERLGPGEQTEPRPQPTSPPPTASPGQTPPERGPAGRPGLPPPPGPPGRRDPTRPPGPPGPTGALEATRGTLSIRVQPVDAEVLVDGERWRGPVGQERLTIELPEGRHSIQVQKPGYRAYVTEIDVRRGETTTLNVSLRSDD